MLKASADSSGFAALLVCPTHGDVEARSPTFSSIAPGRITMQKIMPRSEEQPLIVPLFSLSGQCKGCDGHHGLARDMTFLSFSSLKGRS